MLTPPEPPPFPDIRFSFYPLDPVKSEPIYQTPPRPPSTQGTDSVPNSEDEENDENDEDCETLSPSPTSTESSTPPLPTQNRLLRTLRRLSSWVHQGLEPHAVEGEGAFDGLRRRVKQGGEWCKELATVLHERAEAEAQYGKALTKLAAKLARASNAASAASAANSNGSVSNGNGLGCHTATAVWLRAATQMERQGEAHRSLAAALSDDLVKPLRNLMQAQHGARKAADQTADKSWRGLCEWRQAEAKAKRQSHSAARDNERLQDSVRQPAREHHAKQLLHQHSQTQNGVTSDKDLAKLEAKRRKAEEAVRRADLEYYTFCVRAERARLEWETAVARGSHCFRVLEQERLQELASLAHSYLRHLEHTAPKIVQSIEVALQAPFEHPPSTSVCDLTDNSSSTINGTSPPSQDAPCDQLLPDFYAEHVTLAMNQERRRAALTKILQLIRQDLERERHAKRGVERLARAVAPSSPAESSRELADKLHQLRSMLTYLEASRYKVQSVLNELEGISPAPHPLAPHIHISRDKHGLQQSVLRVPVQTETPPLPPPPNVQQQNTPTNNEPNNDTWSQNDRGHGDGNSVQPDSFSSDFSTESDESVDEEKTHAQQTDDQPQQLCRAIYAYTPKLYDELCLHPGDVIRVEAKQPDGWWLGECGGAHGIFPATYVEEIK